MPEHGFPIRDPRMCLIHGAQDYWGNRFNRYLSLGDLAESNALQLMKVSLVFSGEDAYGFFCTGTGAMCAERHKSPWLNSKRRLRRYEPEQKRHNNQNTKTPNQTTKPKTHNKQNPNRSWLISARDVRKEVKIQRSSTGGETGP